MTSLQRITQEFVDSEAKKLMSTESKTKPVLNKPPSTIFNPPAVKKRPITVEPSPVTDTLASHLPENAFSESVVKQAEKQMQMTQDILQRSQLRPLSSKPSSNVQLFSVSDFKTTASAVADILQTNENFYEFCRFHYHMSALRVAVCFQFNQLSDMHDDKLIRHIMMNGHAHKISENDLRQDSRNAATIRELDALDPDRQFMIIIHVKLPKSFMYSRVCNSTGTSPKQLDNYVQMNRFVLRCIGCHRVPRDLFPCPTCRYVFTCYDSKTCTAIQREQGVEKPLTKNKLLKREHECCNDFDMARRAAVREFDALKLDDPDQWRAIVKKPLSDNEEFLSEYALKEALDQLLVNETQQDELDSESLELSEEMMWKITELAEGKEVKKKTTRRKKAVNGGRRKRQAAKKRSEYKDDTDEEFFRKV